MSLGAFAHLIKAQSPVRAVPYAYGARPSLRKWGWRRGYLCQPRRASHLPLKQRRGESDSREVVRCLVYRLLDNSHPTSPRPQSGGRWLRSLATHKALRGACDRPPR
eukprot:3555329-Pleurochrysis_carterae.AAC.1